MTSHEFDRAIDALARKQHRAFSHPQAKQRGGTDGMIQDRRETGQWIGLWRRPIEADGRRWHTRRADCERDHERDHRAQMHGYEVTRFSYMQLVRCPEHALEVLLAIAQCEAA